MSFVGGNEVIRYSVSQWDELLAKAEWAVKANPNLE
jgi:hypothetical protein